MPAVGSREGLGVPLRRLRPSCLWVPGLCPPRRRRSPAGFRSWVRAGARGSSCTRMYRRQVTLAVPVPVVRQSIKCSVQPYMYHGHHLDGQFESLSPRAPKRKRGQGEKARPRPPSQGMLRHLAAHVRAPFGAARAFGTFRGPRQEGIETALAQARAARMPLSCCAPRKHWQRTANKAPVRTSGQWPHTHSVAAAGF